MQLRRRPAQERVDQEELVEVELAGTPRGGEPGFGLEGRASAGRQCPLRRDPAAGDEERPHVAGLVGRHEDAAPETSHTVEALQLAADPLERRDAVAETARILEPPGLGQLAESATQAR